MPRAVNKRTVVNGSRATIRSEWQFLEVSMRNTPTVAVIVISLLAGSVAGQKKYQRPPVNAPDTFRGADGTSSTDQTSIGDLKWFEVFQDEELQKLVRTAMVQNYDLRLAVARINAARANVGLARSNQFPQFEVGADLTTTRTSANTGVNVPGQSGRSRSIGEVFLSLLTFEIDLWGRLRQQTKAARAELRSTEEDRKTVATIVVSDVASNYFNLLELDMELEIAKRTLTARQESLRLLTARQQGGLATMLDVRQGEELVYQASQTIPDTERLIEQTENQISLLLGTQSRSNSAWHRTFSTEGIAGCPCRIALFATRAAT
jgi:multidrug efflux system outer membrane protein